MRTTRRDRLLKQFYEQRRWIASCEQNGVSYAGTKGAIIRKADENELKRLETELSETPKLQKAR